MKIDLGNFQILFDIVDKKAFSPAGVKGEWQSWTINFDPNFSQTPVVLITPNGDSPNAAAVGVAEDVTKSGFRLEAKNSDSKAGSASFAWVAIGSK